MSEPLRVEIITQKKNLKKLFEMVEIDYSSDKLYELSPHFHYSRAHTRVHVHTHIMSSARLQLIVFGCGYY